MLLEHVQLITERDIPKFAIIEFEEYTQLKALLTDAEQLEDYLDFLHIQQVKAQHPQRVSLDDVKHQLELS